MSQELEEMSTSLFNNQVPNLWAKSAYPSLKPLAAWVTDLVARVKFIKDWIDDGIPTVSIPFKKYFSNSVSLNRTM